MKGSGTGAGPQPRAMAVTDGCCTLLPEWEFSRLSVHSSSEDAARSRPRSPVSACAPSLSFFSVSHRNPD